MPNTRPGLLKNELKVWSWSLLWRMMGLLGPLLTTCGTQLWSHENLLRLAFQEVTEAGVMSSEKKLPAEHKRSDTDFLKHTPWGWSLW